MKRSTAFLMCISLVALVSLPSAAMAADNGRATHDANTTLDTKSIVHMVAYTPYHLPMATVEARGLQYYPATAS